MTEIYASAKYTIVWLGTAGDGSDELFEEYNKIGEKIARPKVVDGGVLPSLTDLMAALISAGREGAAGQKRSHSLAGQIDEAIAHLVDDAQQEILGIITSSKASQKLLSRDYWRRVWIHQEFIVSRDIVIQCGNAILEFSRLSDSIIYYAQLHLKVAQKLAARLHDSIMNSPRPIQLKINRWIMNKWPESNNDPDLQEYKANRRLFNDFCDPRNSLASAGGLLGMRSAYQRRRAKRDGSKRFTMITILTSVFVHGTLDATQARDRIYSMLGMADDKEELRLVPVYDAAMSDTRVYTDAARAMIAAGGVDLLSLAQHGPHSNMGQQEGTRFSSWVPDWTRQIIPPHGHETFAVSRDIPFKRCNLTSSRKLLPGQIELFGWTVDTIETTSPAWINPDDQSSDNNHNTSTFLIDISNLCSTSTKKLGLTGQEIYARVADRKTAHFRIPVADQERNKHLERRRATKYTRECYRWAIKSLLGKLEEKEIGPQGIEPQRMEEIDAISRKFQHYLEIMRLQKSRRPFLSILGYVGLAPEFTKEGDVLVVFCGAKFPYVLRGNCDGTYTLVGEAYVHGIMDGEFVKFARQTETFVLQ